MANISAEVPDFQREAFTHWWSPPQQLLRAIRSYQRCKQNKRGLGAKLLCRYFVFWHRFWSVVTASDIPLNCHIGGGLKLTHPNGVVIHPDAKIGVNCLILQQVTIVQGVIIGGHVDIGAGAKIIKPVKIGDHAKIGANAVVVDDVPEGATAVGIPAKIVAPQMEDGAYEHA